MNTDSHYSVLRFNGSGDIVRINCKHCALSIDVKACKRPGDLSGQPQYNRARGAMVKHLHEKHRGKLGSTQEKTDG